LDANRGIKNAEAGFCTEKWVFKASLNMEWRLKGPKVGGKIIGLLGEFTRRRGVWLVWYDKFSDKKRKRPN